MLKVAVMHSAGNFKVVEVDWLLLLTLLLINLLNVLSRRHRNCLLKDNPKSMNKCTSSMHNRFNIFISSDSSTILVHAGKSSVSGDAKRTNDAIPLSIEAVAFCFSAVSMLLASSCLCCLFFLKI